MKVQNLTINNSQVENYLTWKPFAVEGVSKVDAVTASIEWFMQALCHFDRNKQEEENPFCFYPGKKWKVLSSYADTRNIVASGSHNDSLYVVSCSFDTTLPISLAAKQGGKFALMMVTSSRTHFKVGEFEFA